MKYTVKWIEDHLGITRSALKYYEAKGLMSKYESRNPVNNYREYNESDLDRIWCIKILQGIGFSVREIKALLDNPDSDFYASISQKVSELEKQRDEILQYIDFAKSIKLTGRVPSTGKVGSVRYEDFIRQTRENWNFYNKPMVEPYLSAMNEVFQTDDTDCNENDFGKLEKLASLLNHFQETQITCTMNAYYQIIAEMRGLDYKSKPVQTVVRLLYHFMREQNVTQESEETFNPYIFAKYTAPFFLDGSDIAKINHLNYGKESCQFIAEAIAYFGGYQTMQELYEK